MGNINIAKKNSCFNIMTKSIDSLFQFILNSFNGKKNPELEFLDASFSFIQKQTNFFSKPCSEIKIKTKLNKRITLAKEANISDVENERHKSTRNSTLIKKTSTNKSIEKNRIKETINKGISPVGNGGITSKYTWTQTLNELDVRITVPQETSGKMCEVILTKTRIKVSLKGQLPIVDGELHAPIIDHMWTLETEGQKKLLVINLTKFKGMNWWSSVIKGDPSIDTKKIQPENSRLDDLDGETRQTVEKMMFDQRQKQLGLPTSKEQEQQEKLKKFMRMHPEMDFSQCKFGNGQKNDLNFLK